MVQVLQSIPLVWKFRGYRLELSSSRLRWKAYDDNNQIVSNGYSLNGKKMEKKDVENKVIETIHMKHYLPVIS